MKYFDEIPFAVTACDKDGKILEMNRKSASTFMKDGKSLIGQSLFDCHPEPAKTKLREMIQDPVINAYTIEKNGLKKMIYQSPWYENGEFMGYVELSLVLPEEMPHFVRG
ncbi:MAG: PAS domain-containing protein [Bacteroidales bacterium]|jgi:transcriptional regulator with PAS, ATPase and Fis domain|nr:PAS domain-containing protein [Bacteroidales bacterium]